MLFASVATALGPTFSNIGEFGQTISDYFDVDEAYARGKEIGLSIPIFRYYLSTIDTFFGGFPLMTIFLIILLLMVGIFVFKMIMKFIPFLG